MVTINAMSIKGAIEQEKFLELCYLRNNFNDQILLDIPMIFYQE